MQTARRGERALVEPAPELDVGRAAALRGEVEQALMSEVAGLRASIQLLPSNVEPLFNALEAAP